ncbi:hypothetical protein L9F63_012716 [Diploptera punctata]|uniref:Uncharacterized protein n=1 Tax=Diploptera punctata TaxID=6984 RepID=A0AAD8ACY7_DIPPU|nr:hypothetical protein L9F63_012716 [Diploptera punctata]
MSFVVRVGCFQLIIGFGLPAVVQEQSLTQGTAIKLTYDVPMNATPFTEALFGRSSRSTSRWELYSRLEAACDRLGMDGKACVLRAICEAADVTVRSNGLGGDILHVLLTPSATLEPSAHNNVDRDYRSAERLGATERGRCHLLYPECNTGLLDTISTIHM